ncbi:putative lipid II flippase FtsW [Paenibacillus yanchengensis]|uniref:Probable peptidoglycan glycosyltransferase FtsW n=1 Tax=Paenibacillus yanchengensis TaxID=2035833 RepID=A0ABW4YFP3_9BACL
MSNEEKLKGRPDFLLLFLTVLLVGFGLVMVFSASSAIGLQEYGNPWHFLTRQAVFAFAGFILMLICMRLPLIMLKKSAPLLILVSIVMLVLVLAVGVERGGAQRWFEVMSFTFQPSEVTKLAIIIYLAALISNKGEKIRSIKRGLLPIFVVLGIIFVLVEKQPDYGTMMIMAAIAGVIIVAGGADLRHIGLIGVAALPIIIILAIGDDYRLQRIVSFLNPMEDLLDGSYQLGHSLFAIGHGGWTGTGLGQSVQKLFYLPAPYTDFIYSVIAEEFGFIGSSLFVLVFLLFLWRGFRAALANKETFEILLGVGICAMFSIQFLLNMGAATGSLPITGVTLPFISYGGTSLMLSMVSTGLLLNLSRQADRNRVVEKKKNMRSNSR